MVVTARSSAEASTRVERFSNEPCMREAFDAADDLLVYVTRLVELQHRTGGRQSWAASCRSHSNARALLLACRACRFSRRSGEVTFDHLHGDQVAMFLYFVQTPPGRNSTTSILAKKLTLLNRDRHDCSSCTIHSCPRSSSFRTRWARSSGKGSYGNYAVFCQNVTHDDDYAR